MRLIRSAKLQALALVPAAALAIGVLAAPASAASNTANVQVQVATAAVQATIGVAYSAGSNITCTVGTNVSGFQVCTNNALITGTFRSTKADAGGTSISLTGATINGTGGNTIAPAAFQMAVSAGAGATAGTGILSAPAPTFPGTAVQTLPSSAVALSSSAVACQSWTGPIVASYSLVVALSLDAGQVLADTYTVQNFVATATAN